MGGVFAVGVGPGSPDYVTEAVRKIIVSADVVVVMNTRLRPSPI